MGIRTLQNSFNGGEVSPSLYGRFDDQKYAMGAATVRNFICLPQGPVVNRPGFAFVRAAKYADKVVRLIPFTYSSEQTMALEFGDKYIRFHTEGKTLINSDGTPYEIESPYAADDLFQIHYTQSADVVTLVHPNYAPRELRRYGPADWRLIEIDFSLGIKPPTGLTVKFTSGDTSAKGQTNYKPYYRITALKDTDGGTVESEPCAAVFVECNLYIDNSYNTITWDKVEGAQRYRVYKTYSGVYGLLGETENTNYTDTNFDTDSSITPPRLDDVFSGNNWPSAVTYFQQRRVFGGAIKKPRMMWMTASGTESNFVYTIPAQADNRIRFEVAAQEAARITHIVPLSSLIVLTGSSEFRIQATDGGALTSETVTVSPQASIGANEVQPVIVNSTLVYAANRGGHIRELGYNYQASGFTTGDLSIRAAHLFENTVTVDMARMKAPDSILWFVMADGKLLGLTYLPEQGVAAWHRHDTDGAFESVCCVPEGQEDALYAVVRRTINGQSIRYIERMHERYYATLEDAFHVDCGGTYKGKATKTISGLTWLEGKTVAILANGGVLPQQTVKDGKVELPVEVTYAHIGLPITAELKTLPVAMQMQDGSYGRGHMKNVNKVFIRVYRSSGISVGPDEDHLTAVKMRGDEPFGEPPQLLSEEIPLAVSPKWTDGGQIVIQQKNPLPITVVSWAADMAQ